MKYETKYKPSYAMLVVTLNQNETITAEAGSMTYMSPTSKLAQENARKACSELSVSR